MRQQGWTASLFVTPAPARGLAAEPEATLEPRPTVNARLGRRLSRTSRIAIDFTNVLGRAPPPVAGASFLEAAPVPGRGLAIQFRKSF